MSEVLRAILDHNCLDSRPAFYAAQIITAVPNTGVVTLGLRRATITCKSNAWFLCMGAAEDSGFFNPGGPYIWDAKAASRTFQISRGNTGEAFSIRPQQQSLINYNLNNFNTLEEYILFEPAELIQVDVDIRLTSTANITAYSFVTLMGIEYRMPPGKGKWHG